MYQVQSYSKCNYLRNSNKQCWGTAVENGARNSLTLHHALPFYSDETSSVTGTTLTCTIPDVPGSTRDLSCNQAGEETTVNEDNSLTCDTTVPETFCPPGTQNSPDNPSPQFCIVDPVPGETDLDKRCPFGIDQVESDAKCNYLRNSNKQCWGTAVENGAGSCVTDTRDLSCNSDETSSVTGTTLTCTIPDVSGSTRDLSCNQAGEETTVNEGNTLTCTIPDVPG